MSYLKSNQLDYWVKKHIKLIFIRKANKFYYVLFYHFSDCFYAPRKNVFEKLKKKKKYMVSSLSGPGIYLQ